MAILLRPLFATLLENSPPQLAQRIKLLDVVNSMKEKFPDGELQKYGTPDKIYFAVFKFLLNRVSKKI